MFYISNSFIVDEDVKDIWAQWMKDTFVPALEEEDIIKEVIFSMVLADEPLESPTYSLLVKIESKDFLSQFDDLYFGSYFPLIQKRFENKHVTFRTYLQKL